MSLKDYTTEELESEVAQRRGAEKARLNRLRKEHYEQKCSHCTRNLNDICGEWGAWTRDVTGCSYFKDGRSWT